MQLGICLLVTGNPKLCKIGSQTMTLRTTSYYDDKGNLEEQSFIT